MTNKPRLYTSIQATEMLCDELSRWYCEDGSIRREYKTASWKSTLMVVNTIGHLAEVAWHHPDLHVSYNRVVVSLMTHSEKGITNLDFELAGKIEEVVMWRPGIVSEYLTGTPDTDRHRYISYP